VSLLAPIANGFLPIAAGVVSGRGPVYRRRLDRIMVALPQGRLTILLCFHIALFQFYKHGHGGALGVALVWSLPGACLALGGSEWWYQKVTLEGEKVGYNGGKSGKSDNETVANNAS
jgi:hypothetical protein